MKRNDPKNKNGLLLAATIVALAALFTIGTTWHFARKEGLQQEGVRFPFGGKDHDDSGPSIWEKAKHHLHLGHSKGQFDDLGSPSMWERAKHHLHLGRHEALQQLREALGVESGEPISSKDKVRLEELLRLDEYSHSEGFWDRMKDSLESSKDKTKEHLESGKDQLKSEMEKGQNKMEEVFRKFQIEKGGKPTASERLREALGLEEDKPLNEKAVEKLKKILGIEKGKSISKDTLDQLKEALGYHEPTLWEKAKAKLHIRHDQPSTLEQTSETLKEKIHDFKDKVKGAVGLGKDHTDKLIEKAMDKVSESEELLSESEKLLQMAYSEHSKEKDAHVH